VKRAIQLGVQEGALGLIERQPGERQGGELVLHTLKYEEPIPLDAVDFSSDQRLLTRETSAELQAQSAADEEPNVGEEGAGEPEAETVTPGSGPPIGGDSTGTDAGEHEGAGPQPPPETVYHHLRLVIADIPSGKIGDVNRGIFLPLSNRVDGGLRFTLELDVTSAEGIPERTLEQTIKETVRQIGARIEEEETGL
jgi:hypothetical protein